ncbi:MAG: HdeD family acid-resistance protein [Desulfobacteraceae bacterium]
MWAADEREIGSERAVVFGDAKKNWNWLLILGVIFIALGAVGLGRVFALTVASVLFFGVLLLIGGGIQLFESFKCKGWKSILFHMLIAILYILLGIEIIARPMVASAVLTLLLAGGIMLVGIVRIVMAIQLRNRKNWGWPLLSGIISVLLGLVIAAKWPVSGLFVIGLFVAIELIMHGWSYIFIALAAKSALETSQAEG